MTLNKRKMPKELTITIIISVLLISFMIGFSMGLYSGLKVILNGATEFIETNGLKINIDVNESAFVDRVYEIVDSEEFKNDIKE